VRKRLEDVLVSVLAWVSVVVSVGCTKVKNLFVKRLK